MYFALCCSLVFISLWGKRFILSFRLPNFRYCSTHQLIPDQETFSLLLYFCPKEVLFEYLFYRKFDRFRNPKFECAALKKFEYVVGPENSEILFRKFEVPRFEHQWFYGQDWPEAAEKILNLKLQDSDLDLSIPTAKLKQHFSMHCIHTKPFEYTEQDQNIFYH